MAYSDYEVALVDAYLNDVRRGKINPVNTDLQSNNARNSYNGYLNGIIRLQPKEFLVTDFETVDFSIFRDLCIEIVALVFGEEFIEDFVLYFQTIRQNGSKEFLDGIVISYGMEGTDEVIGRETEIPNISCLGCIVTVMHEFVHFLASKYKMDFNKKRYYEEILSILVEKITADYLTHCTSDKEVSRKVNLTRLESIKFHYENLTQIEQVFELYNSQKKQGDNLLSLALLERKFPFFKNRRSINYWRNLADSYGMGFLYSESLFSIFYSDPKELLIGLRKTLKGDLELRKFLSRYQINANNDEVYEKANLRIKTLN